MYVKNFAIIQEVEIEFQPGLTVITGETGAGKSILLGALSLILGERADLQLVASNADKCIVEGRFDINTLTEVKQFLLHNDLDESNELILRREIAPGGKSRAFINDTPTTLTTLSTLSTLLIDLHRQFDTIDLQHQRQQLHMFDAIAGLKQEVHECNYAFQLYQTAKQKWSEVTQRNKIIKQEQDYNQYLFDELDKLQLRENELEEIDSELAILNNGEALKSSLQKAVYDFNETDSPIIAKLKSILQSLEPFTPHSSSLSEITERLKSMWIEAKDISNELEHLADATSYNAEKVDLLTNRLNEGYRLLKKHHCTTTNELLQCKTSIESKLKLAITADEEETKLKQIMDLKWESVNKLATALSQKRQQVLPEIQARINALLPKVGLPNAKMLIEEQTIEINAHGINKVEFKIDANKTGKFQPIGKAASGGELSRIMLCIKSLQAKSTQMPTMLFDEIDTGISGETAIQLSTMMRELAVQHQIICITHLPQIAGKGSQHLYIYKKENKAGKIMTSVKYLNEEERITALSEMIGGKQSNKDALNMVKQLMK